MCLNTFSPYFMRQCFFSYPFMHSTKTFDMHIKHYTLQYIDALQYRPIPNMYEAI